MKSLPPRMIVLLILALFILPLALAWMMFTGSIRFEAKNTRNLGELVIPTVPLDWAGVTPVAGGLADNSFYGFWVILHAPSIPCANPCRERVTDLRQVHIAAGQNHDQVKIVLLLAPGFPEALIGELRAIYPRFNLVSDPSQAFKDALRQAASNSVAEDGDPAIYLVDPRGNIMMTYNRNDSPNLLNKDLKRLLTWSKLEKRS